MNNRRVYRITTLALVVLLAFVSGCDDKIGDYMAASSILKNGFSIDRKQALNLAGKEIKIWGFVDHGNIYANDAKDILEDWWSGNGPSPTTWRFGLKGKKNDEMGHAITIHVANDQGRDKLLKRFLEDARADRTTTVFLKGKIFTFDAPTNFDRLTGLYMEVEASKDILIDDPEQ